MSAAFIVHRGQHRDAVCFQCAAFRTATAAQARRRKLRAERIVRLRSWQRRIRWAYILAWAALRGRLIEGEWNDANGSFRWTGFYTGRRETDMDMATISVTEDQAKEALEQYRTAMRESAQKEVRELTQRARERRAAIEAQDKAILKGYEMIAKHKTVISLRGTLVQGGEDDQHRPKLAVARADERQIEMIRWESGRVDFRGDQSWRDKDYAEKPWNSNRDFSFMELLPVAEGIGPRGWSRIEAHAILPHIPPGLRPDALERYFVLWEADWQRKMPIDPALLRHLRGDLYAVIATWDLTELERAVLDG